MQQHRQDWVFRRSKALLVSNSARTARDISWPKHKRAVNASSNYLWKAVIVTKTTLFAGLSATLADGGAQLLIRLADINVREATILVRVADINVREATLLVRVADLNVREATLLVRVTDLNVREATLLVRVTDLQTS